jgi:hypothetical protein
MNGHLVRLEYLTPAGWAVALSAGRILEPQEYVDGLAKQGKFARCTELDDKLQPVGEQWQADDIPAIAELPPFFSALAKRGVTECSDCGEPHAQAWACLI